MHCRDQDVNLTGDGPGGGPDGTLEQRRYAVQNWRHDVAAVVNLAGRPVEWNRYTAYGEVASYPYVDGDYDGDGDTDSDDINAFSADWDNGEADVNRDGGTDSDDTQDFFESWDNGITKSDSIGAASGLRFGYAGYVFDFATGQYHVRHRVYEPRLGRWTRRDPLKSRSSGVSLYGFCDARALAEIDWSGLQSGGCSDHWGVIPRDWKYRPGPSGEINMVQYLQCLGDAQKWAAKRGVAQGSSCYDAVVGSYVYACTATSAFRDDTRDEDGGQAAIRAWRECNGRFTWRSCPGLDSPCANWGRAPGVGIPINNGCGSTAFQRIALKGLFPGTVQFFFNCCGNHDACYGACGSDKNTCDSNFRQCLLASCKSSYSWRNPIGRLDCLRTAEEFAWAVRTFGEGPFCSAQKANCICK